MSRRVYLPVVDRRVVLRGAAAALVASLAGCRKPLDDSELGPDAGVDAPAATGGVERCADKLCLSLADPANEALRTVEGYRVIEADGRKLIVVRVTETDFVALSAICTHQGCVVRYAEATDRVVCPCHGSQFALDGSVARGPAITPLATYPATYDAATDTVLVTF